MKPILPALLDCRPESLEIDLNRTAVVCIDMQNAFVHKGGMFDLAGWPTEGARVVIEPCRKIVEAARAARHPLPPRRCYVISGRGRRTNRLLSRHHPSGSRCR